MRKRIASMALVITAVCLSVVDAAAQSAMLNLPDVSQAARITQRIGITDITVDYHRPRVRDRKIFGGLVPYGKVWRAGANVNTIISFSDPVTIDGQILPKGVYGLHMEEELCRRGFVRIHRSLVVNSAWVAEILPSASREGTVRMRGGEQYPVGRSYKKSLHLLAHVWLCIGNAVS